MLVCIFKISWDIFFHSLKVWDGFEISIWPAFTEQENSSVFPSMRDWRQGNSSEKRDNKRFSSLVVF